MHFEDLWVRVEKTTNDTDLEEFVYQIKRHDSILSGKDFDFDTIGEILLYLAVLSKKNNVNVFDALKEAEERWLDKEDVEDESNYELPLEVSNDRS